MFSHIIMLDCKTMLVLFRTPLQPNGLHFKSLVFHSPNSPTLYSNLFPSFFLISTVSQRIQTSKSSQSHLPRFSLLPMLLINQLFNRSNVQTNTVSHSSSNLPSIPPFPQFLAPKIDVSNNLIFLSTKLQ